MGSSTKLLIIFVSFCGCITEVNCNAIDKISQSTKRNEGSFNHESMNDADGWIDELNIDEYYNDDEPEDDNSSKKIIFLNNDPPSKMDFVGQKLKTQADENAKILQGRKKFNPLNELTPSDEIDFTHTGIDSNKNRKKSSNQKIPETIRVKPFDVLKGSAKKRKRKFPNHQQQPQRPHKLQRQQTLLQHQHRQPKKLTRNPIKGTMNEKIVMEKKGYLKEDWCKTKRYNLEIKEPGCYVKNIKNNFCYGQCNSFYIPRNPVKSYPYINQQANTDTKINRSPDKETSYNEDEDDDADEENMDNNTQSKDYFMSCASCVAQSIKWKEVVLTCPKKHPPYIVKKVRVVQNCKCVAVVVN